MKDLPDLKHLSREELEDLTLTLWRQVQSLSQHLESLSRRVEELEARLNEPPKNSGNSSVPPSKDFKSNKEDKKDKGTGGVRRGSLGRKGHHRPLSENPDEIVRVMAKSCAQCGEGLSEADQTLSRAYDKIDIPPIKPHITRVEIYEGSCPCCRHATSASVVPAGLEEGSPFSLNIVALAIYLRVTQMVSYERLSRIFRDLFGLAISEGALDALLRRAKPCFDSQVAAILTRLRQSRAICSDETGIRVKGLNHWNWVFQNKDVVLHVIRRSRGKVVVEEVLDGHRPYLWVSDLYGAQLGHAEHWQVCLAHQLRNCQYAIEAGDTLFAPRMKRLFLVAFVIAKRRLDFDEAKRLSCKRRLEQKLDAILALPVEHKDARRLQKRYKKHRHSLFTFLAHPEVDPDNNSSERALRPVTTYRKVTGGFRSLWGADLYAAVRSTVGTASRQGIHAFEAIRSALQPALASMA